MPAYAYMPYAITEFFCIAFAVAILFRLNSSIGSKHEITQLRRMVYAYVVMLATDVPWALNLDGMIPSIHIISALTNGLSLCSVSLGCYFWFNYVEERIHPNIGASRQLNIALAIPVAAICLLDVISIFTGWVFYIDESNEYQLGELFIVSSVIDYTYLVVPLIGALRKAVHTKAKSQRTEFLSYPAYMVVPLICGLAEDSLPTVPILSLSIFMVILIFFLSIQSRQISTDALTGLNNRRWLNQFVEKKLPAASADEPIMLFMMDINDFKSINDAYGHIEGDTALKSFATALRLTAARYNAFIARYGGDEFCLVAEIARNNPFEIERNILETLETVQSTIIPESKPYQLSISIGYAVCDHPETNTDAFIGRADDVLYENKQKWHRNTGHQSKD